MPRSKAARRKARRRAAQQKPASTGLSKKEQQAKPAASQQSHSLDLARKPSAEEHLPYDLSTIVVPPKKKSNALPTNPQALDLEIVASIYGLKVLVL